MDSVYECLPAIITDADRPLALQRLQQTSALSAMLESMLQLKVGIYAAASRRFGFDRIMYQLRMAERWWPLLYIVLHVG
jgi:hypothetical protein